MYIKIAETIKIAFVSFQKCCRPTFFAMKRKYSWSSISFKRLKHEKYVFRVIYNNVRLAEFESNDPDDRKGELRVQRSYILARIVVNLLLTFIRYWRYRLFFRITSFYGVKLNKIKFTLYTKWNPTATQVLSMFLFIDWIPSKFHYNCFYFLWFTIYPKMVNFYCFSMFTQYSKQLICLLPNKNASSFDDLKNNFFSIYYRF